MIDWFRLQTVKTKTKATNRTLAQARTYESIGGGTIFKGGGGASVEERFSKGGTKLKWPPNFDHWGHFSREWGHKTKGALNFDHRGIFQRGGGGGGGGGTRLKGHSILITEGTFFSEHYVMCSM